MPDLRISWRTISTRLLDKSDLVFVDAPGTGYSKILPKIDPKTVWGMDEDTAAFGQFIERYVTFNDRWNSPKFLLGESYGTPRSAMLVDYLQNRYMAFNGVVLLSSVLDESTIAPAPGNDLPYAIYLPTEAAVHWYYDKSPGKGSLDATARGGSHVCQWAVYRGVDARRPSIARSVRSNRGRNSRTLRG